MDATIKNRIKEIQQALEQEELRISMADPVAKMMLVALAHQANMIDRKIDGSVDRLAEKFCDQVLQNSDLRALPAMSIVKVGNGREYAPYVLDTDVCFSLKGQKCNFRPLFKTQVVPGNVVCSYADGVLHIPYAAPVEAQKGEAQHGGEVWVAYEVANELNSLEGCILALNHPLSADTDLQVEVGQAHYGLRPAMEEDVYAFDMDFMLIEYWKQHLVYHKLWLYRFGQPEENVPVVKTDMPVWLHEMFDADTLAPFSSRRYVWLRITSALGCRLRPDTHIEFNCLPVANYDINHVKLSYTEPIKPLENLKSGTQFLNVMADAALAGEYFIRDFDVNQYDNARLYDDILSLYHHYVDDYYAFVDSNALNDGTVLRNLRMGMVQIKDALSDVTNSNKPYSGVYAIRTPQNNQQPIVISYLTTQGHRGNALKAGNKLGCSLAASGEVYALCDASGGRDKLSGSMARREMAKYVVSCNNRLFTRMDVLQYCKLEFLRALGDDALRFCKISMEESNRAVSNHIEKCLNLTFAFTSERYYRLAQELNFAEYLQVNVDLRKSFSYGLNITLCL